MTTSYFTSPEGRRLAFRHNPASAGKLTFVWMCGFKSDISGTKVLRLEDWANRTGHGFLAFDYSGHGESDGAFEDGTVSQWREDALAAIDSQTDGPLVIVGSSMGGWMALLAALARPDRVKGLVLIAPAPDFTEKLMWPEFPAKAQAEIMEQGFTLRPSDYDEPYTITRALIEDGRQWQVLDKPIDFDGPVRILQGMQVTGLFVLQSSSTISRSWTPLVKMDLNEAGGPTLLWNESALQAAQISKVRVVEDFNKAFGGGSGSAGPVTLCV